MKRALLQTILMMLFFTSSLAALPYMGLPYRSLRIVSSQNVYTDPLLVIYILAFDNPSTAKHNLSSLSTPTIEGIVAATAGQPDKKAVILIDQDGVGDTQIITAINGLSVTMPADDVLTSLPDMPANEYDMTNSTTLGEFLTWALDNLATAETKTVLSYVGHGAGVTPDAELDFLQQQNKSRLSANPLFPLPSYFDVNLEFTDDKANYDPMTGEWSPSMLSPRNLADALAQALTNNQKFDVLDMVHCFSASIEEFYELSSYAETITGSPNFAYFGPQMSGRLLAALDSNQTVEQLASTVIDVYDTVIVEAEELAPISDHPRLLTAVKSDQLPAVVSAWDNLSTALLASFGTDYAATRAALGVSYHDSNKYDTSYCHYKVKFTLESPDALLDAGHFAEQLANHFGGNPTIINAATSAQASITNALISKKAVSGQPWFASSGVPVWDFSDYMGLSIYGDLGGQLELGKTYLSWQSHWYTESNANGNNPNPYSFVLDTAWDEVLEEFWADELAQGNIITLQCMPDIPAVKQKGELTVSALLAPDPLTLSVDDPITFTAQISTSQIAYNPLMSVMVTQHGQTLYSETIGSGYLITGTHAVEAPVWLPSHSGPFTVTVTIDADNRVGEVDEGNNSLTQTGLLQGAVLAFEPAQQTVGVGESFDYPIMLYLADHSADGVAAHLDFDPTILEVDGVTLGSALPTTIQNKFDNKAGTIDIAAGAFNNFPDDSFLLATVTFTALQDTQEALIAFNSTWPRKSDITFAGQSILNGSVPGMVTILETGLFGTVSLQGRSEPPDLRLRVPLSVTLTLPGNASPTYSFTTTTNNKGSFMIDGILPGTYDVRVKKANALQNKETVTFSPGVTSVHFGTLLEGDADNDNYVTLRDFSILATAYSTCEGDATYDPRADFDGDGCVLLIDFSLLASNFAQGGEARAVRTAEPALQPISNNVSLTIEPAQSTVKVGELFTAMLLIEAGEQKVDAAQASLNFDPTLLEIVHVQAGPDLPLNLLNQVDNSSGRLDFAAGALEAFPSGTFTLLEVQFLALSSTWATGTPLELQAVAPRLTDVTFSGVSVLGEQTNSQLIIHSETTSVILNHFLSLTPNSSPILAFFSLLMLLASGWLIWRRRDSYLP